jgi:uncharacterized protein YdeI (YjbR/CyaY-like superfamily)
MQDTPTDLAAALQHAGLSQFFADCTESHRREFLQWISETKRPETRAARVAKTTEMLAARRARELARAT